MEFFDIVDEKGIPTGETIERIQAHKKGVRHRTAHIWIVREQNGKAQLLLQKRSAEKDSFPGRFDTSSAGHIQAGDEPEESAIRELHEELGIRAAKEDLKRNCNSPDALIFNTKRNFMEKCFGTTRLHSSICTLSR